MEDTCLSNQEIIVTIFIIILYKTCFYTASDLTMYPTESLREVHSPGNGGQRQIVIQCFTLTLLGSCS